MEINPDSGLRVTERVLPLITDEGRSVHSIGKLRLVSTSDEDIFCSPQVSFVYENIEVAEFSKSYVPV